MSNDAPLSRRAQIAAAKERARLAMVPDRVKVQAVQQRKAAQETHWSADKDTTATERANNKLSRQVQNAAAKERARLAMEADLARVQANKEQVRLAMEADISKVTAARQRKVTFQQGEPPIVEVATATKPNTRTKPFGRGLLLLSLLIACFSCTSLLLPAHLGQPRDICEDGRLNSTSQSREECALSQQSNDYVLESTVTWCRSLIAAYLDGILESGKTLLSRSPQAQDYIELIWDGISRLKSFIKSSLSGSGGHFVAAAQIMAGYFEQIIEYGKEILSNQQTQDFIEDIWGRIERVVESSPVWCRTLFVIIVRSMGIIGRTCTQNPEATGRMIGLWLLRRSYHQSQWSRMFAIAATMTTYYCL